MLLAQQLTTVLLGVILHVTVAYRTYAACQVASGCTARRPRPQLPSGLALLASHRGISGVSDYGELMIIVKRRAELSGLENMYIPMSGPSDKNYASSSF